MFALMSIVCPMPCTHEAYDLRPCSPRASPPPRLHAALDDDHAQNASAVRPPVALAASEDKNIGHLLVGARNNALLEDPANSLCLQWRNVGRKCAQVETLGVHTCF